MHEIKSESFCGFMYLNFLRLCICMYMGGYNQQQFVPPSCGFACIGLRFIIKVSTVEQSRSSNDCC